MTFCQLREEVARYRAALKAVGVTANDRVVGQLPISFLHLIVVHLSCRVHNLCWMNSNHQP